MNMSLRWTLAAVLAAGAGTVCAHHDWSEYDRSKPLNIAGSIKESVYEYPHGHVQLQTSDKVWLVVLAPPSRMSARGLPAGALKPGIRAEVIGYANRQRADEMRAERITVNGKTIELR